MTTFFMSDLVSRLWVDITEKLQFNHVWILYILDLGLGWKSVFYENIINIAKVSWENSKPSRRYQIFRPGRRTYMYTLPPFIDAILSEERQLMKWLGIFQVRIFWVEIFRKKNFPEESLMGGNFPGRNFPGSKSKK